ncbi:UNVERIFIED_ORG: putative nuclease of restriction endonuclease-like (RecB) superfamily [Pseudomonas fluorescens]|nr:putative nuclease of restriction endonuclease-like (RecB) superfamily [Pseudomonas fluorescens]
MLLQDREALLAKPGAHHKALLSEAHHLHRAQIIDSSDLCDFLDLADAALAFAVEALHDLKTEH